MKKITWAQFSDIVEDPESLIIWNGNICTKTAWEHSFSFDYEETLEEFSCDIEEGGNERIYVENNTFHLWDSEQAEEIQIQIFRKVPWIIE